MQGVFSHVKANPEAHGAEAFKQGGSVGAISAQIGSEFALTEATRPGLAEAGAGDHNLHLTAVYGTREAGECARRAGETASAAFNGGFATPNGGVFNAMECSQFRRQKPPIRTQNGFEQRFSVSQ